MKRLAMSGFALIEVLVFIIVTSLAMSVILMSANTALIRSPTTHQQWVAIQTAKQCMEWFINQRRILGYTALSCPDTPSPSACTAPTGFTVSTAISCTSWNSDINYKTITVSVTGLASVTLSSQIGKY